MSLGSWYATLEPGGSCTALRPYPPSPGLPTSSFSAANASASASPPAPSAAAPRRARRVASMTVPPVYAHLRHWPPSSCGLRSPFVATGIGPCRLGPLGELQPARIETPIFTHALTGAGLLGIVAFCRIFTEFAGLHGTIRCTGAR